MNAYHASSHDSQELIEVESFFDLLAHFCIDVADVLLLYFHPEGFHDGLQFAGVDFTWVSSRLPVFLLSKILKASLSSLMVSSSCSLFLAVLGGALAFPSLCIIILNL